jgi:phosphorylcholine phosphatase
MSELSLWPIEAQTALKNMMASNRGQPTFAVFDADNTIWQWDIEEALLAYYDESQKLNLSSFSLESLPIPPLKDESLYGYYDRLSQIDHSIGYHWAAQIFAGLRLSELQKDVDTVMSHHSVYHTHTTSPEGTQTISVQSPQIFPAQKQLIQTLQKNNIDVWVISASAEEVVRMVVSHPKYGLNIPPEKVIGVNFLFHTSEGGVSCGAMERANGKKGLDYYFSSDRLDATLGRQLFAPATWYGGKLAAIKEWIHPSQRPILAAGDSTNDQYMLFYADVDHGGCRILIDRGVGQREAYDDLRHTRSKRQNGADQNPNSGWIIATPEALGGADN